MTTLSQENPPQGTIFRKCVFCEHETAHKVLASVCEGRAASPEHERQRHYQTIQCQGCKKPYFQIVEVIVCLTDPEEQLGSELLPGDAYPLPVELRRPSPLLADQAAVPPAVWEVYRQSLAAAEGNLLTLAGLGFRTVVEAVCKDKGATGSNLDARVDSLARKGLVTQEGASTLHGPRLLGNMAAHEAKEPSQAQVLACKAVVEHLLNAAYVLPSKVGVLPRTQKNLNGTGGRGAELR